MMNETNRATMLTGSFIAIFAMVFLSALIIGRYSLEVGDLIAYIKGDLSPLDSRYVVIHNLRIPRTIVAALIGIGLSLSGLLYQETFQNKLISPDFLGVTSGASVGAAFAILMGFTSVWISTFAFLTGIVTVLITLTLSKCFQNRSPTILLLSGIIVGSLMSATLSLIKYFADPESTLASITFWLMGSCQHVTMNDAMLLLPIIGICCIILVMARWRINLVALGREEAQTKGINYNLYRRGIIIMATLMTASSVAIVGCIGWIGLVVPHMVRIMVGRNTANTIPLTIFFGATFMILVDILSRTFTDSEVPLSAITGFLGTVIFIAILYIRRRTILDSN